MPKKSKPDHENRENSSGHARKPDREEKSDGGSNYRRQIKEKKLAEAKSKDGCLPKLFMLLLPFAAVGAYLLLQSS